MPFKLKNARATFQKLINKAFSEHIGRNVKAYVDDIVVKSKRSKYYIEDLNEVFEILRKHNINFNSEKYIFEVFTGKFLGFMVSQRRIKANLEKI